MTLPKGFELTPEQKKKQAELRFTASTMKEKILPKKESSMVPPPAPRKTFELPKGFLKERTEETPFQPRPPKTKVIKSKTCICGHHRYNHAGLPFLNGCDRCTCPRFIRDSKLDKVVYTEYGGYRW